jgi:hypothetical protein
MTVLGKKIRQSMEHREAEARQFTPDPQTPNSGVLPLISHCCLDQP